jgi:two-component system, chemotaxis family, chemotaxis protein CheY
VKLEVYVMQEIMVVDDSRFIRKYLKGILNQHGYTTIYEASNGEEAIDQYMYVNPDIVILDITMPNISGLTVLKKFLEFDPEATVIMCSSMGTGFNIVESKKIGAKGFIVKPYFNEVVDVIKSVVEN